MLLEMLHADLRFDFLDVSIDEETYFLEAKILMARKSDNCFSSVELSWQMD